MATNNLTRRQALSLAAKFAAVTCALKLSGRTKNVREFNIRDYGAVGDGNTLDSAAVQRAIDEAAATGADARVIVPGGRRYLVGTIQLKGTIDFHLADDAELLASIRPEDYGTAGAVLTARDVQGLSLTGTGRINGRSREFMAHFDEQEEWWRPKPFRPRLALLASCRDLTVRDITLAQAPSWTLHLVGCQQVLVDAIKIRNQLDVPNCDGIDPDHCRDVEIRNCDIICGDDPIVIKATRPFAAYGGSSNIHVHDCVIETQSSGVKIGTETVCDIHHVRFERCKIKTGSRGCCIQLRDEGDVHDVLFRDITFKSRYHSVPWWGRGEAISFTALPRTPGGKVGRIHDVRMENVTGLAENSVRISGSPESRIGHVAFENVAITLDRWTKYPGGVWDNRPTGAGPGIEEHGNPGIHVRYADHVSLQRCRIAWGDNRPDYFTHALEAHDVTGLTHPDFIGEAAHPERDAAIAIK